MPEEANRSPLAGTQKSPAEKLLIALLLALTAAAVLRTLFCGLEIDEEYALSISWRLVKGDALFLTMWEPHQLSSLPVAAVLWLYYTLTGGTTGVLLFVRFFTLACKGLLAWVFYRQFRPLLGKAAFPAALVLFLYTPKWFLAPDYISQQFHFMLAAFLCIWPYYAPGKNQYRRLWLMLPAGLFLSLSVLAFPQSAFAAPVLLVGMVVLGVAGGERRWLRAIPRGALALALCCMGCAGLFVAFVLRNMSLSQLIMHAQLILNDPQYDFTFGQRMALLGRQAVDVAKILVKPMALALALSVYGCVRGIWQHNIRNVRYWLNVFFALWAGITTAWCIVRALLDTSLDERYFLPVLVLGGFWWLRAGKGTVRRPLFWLGFLPGVAAYLLILRSTLLGFAPTFMYLTWPAFIALLALALQAKEASDGAETPCTPFALQALWPLTLLWLFFAFLVVCRLWLVLVTGWKPASLGQTPLQYMAQGPAAGTWADAATADRYEALTLALAGHEGEKVLLSTGDVDGLAYLMDEGTLRFGQASVISSTDSDTRFSAYYTEHPDKTPDVIVYNLNCVRDLDAFHSWLEENLTIAARHKVSYGTAKLEVLEVAPPQ